VNEPRPLLLGMGWFPDQPGGLNRYFRALVEQLGEARAAVIGPVANPPPSVTVGGSRREPLPLRLLAFRREARRLIADADVVDAHLALTALPLLRASRRVPLVVHFHGPWADEARFEGAPLLHIHVKRMIEQLVFRRARVFVAMSNAFAQLLADRYGVDPARIEVVPPGVDLDRFAPGDRAAARARLGIRPDTFVVATARRLVPRMGIDVLLRAWPQIAESRGETLLVVAGDGPERARLEAEARGPVRFLGRVDDETLVGLYRAADVCVVPSVALEGFGLVALEALACGTPVVVTNVGGLPEAVAGLDPTLAVEPGDADALAARVLARLPARDACYVHARKFSWEAAADRHREVYRRAVRPRVVYLGHTSVLSGGELALARMLPALDVEAHVILAEEGPLADELRLRGVSVEVLPLAERTRSLGRESAVTHLPFQLVRTLVHSVRLARRLRAIRPDVVHTNSLKAAFYGGVAARLAGVPVVWHIRDRIADDYMPRTVVALVRAVARIVPSAIVANSNATLSTLPKRKRTFVVASPVDIPSGAHARKDGALRVGMIGRIAPWKGQHVFLEAFADAFADGGAVAQVVGAPLFGADEEEYADDLRGLARNLGIEQRVVFTGFRDDVAGELADLDILVHASTLPEPFGQVVVEGMAAGLPVVATDAGGPVELIEPGRNGMLYPPGDAPALAGVLRRLADDAELRSRLGAAAHETAAAFTPEAIAQRLDEVYAEVMRR
jgi:glycosyltransferase involved in cell wall biosynthesis